MPRSTFDEIDAAKRVFNAHKYAIGQEMLVDYSMARYPTKIYDYILVGAGVSVDSITLWCNNNRVFYQPLYVVHAYDGTTKIIAEEWLKPIHAMEEIW